MSPHDLSTYCYTVEVSGWDPQERFFVENTDLEWHEPAGKRIRLRTHIERGSILFVRLFGPESLDVLPVAYEAQQIQRAENSMYYEVVIAQVQPIRSRSAVRGAGNGGDHAPEM
jgi:hypothetical protein